MKRIGEPMKELGVLYENETPMKLVNMSLMVKKGIKLLVVSDCFDECNLHEGSTEKPLKRGDIVEVLGCWFNFYGSYVKCTINNETYDVKPSKLAYITRLN
jgi:hypothetical protein